MVETCYLDDELKTHTQGPPPPMPPPPDGPDDRGPHGDDGEEPRRFPLKNAHLGMLIVIGAETMFFAGLLGACLILRQAAPVWPPPAFTQLPLRIELLATLVLMMSALTMWRAQQARRRWHYTRSARLLLSTAFLGGAFLACQGYEWIQLTRSGLTLASGTYGTVFYTLIGCHGMHVSGAVIWVAVVTRRAYQEDADLTRPVGLSLCSMYWYYIVALWPALYVLLYYS